MVSPPAVFRGLTSQTPSMAGGDWHEALMELELEVPDPDAWTAGARRFHCELWSILTLNLIEQETGSTISFRGLLTTSAPCSSPHRGEFVGAYTAPAGPWPSTGTARKIADRGCEALVAHYVGFPSWRQLKNPYVGYLQLGFRESQWDMGDRSARCYVAVYTADHEFVGSVKGIGSRKPKG